MANSKMFCFGGLPQFSRFVCAVQIPCTSKLIQFIVTFYAKFVIVLRKGRQNKQKEARVWPIQKCLCYLWHPLLQITPVESFDLHPSFVSYSFCSLLYTFSPRIFHSYFVGLNFLFILLPIDASPINYNLFINLPYFLSLLLSLSHTHTNTQPRLSHTHLLSLMLSLSLSR